MWRLVVASGVIMTTFVGLLVLAMCHATDDGDGDDDYENEA